MSMEFDYLVETSPDVEYSRYASIVLGGFDEDIPARGLSADELASLDALLDNGVSVIGDDIYEQDARTGDVYGAFEPVVGKSASTVENDVRKLFGYYITKPWARRADHSIKHAAKHNKHAKKVVSARVKARRRKPKRGGDEAQIRCSIVDSEQGDEYEGPCEYEAFTEPGTDSDKDDSSVEDNSHDKDYSSDNASDNDDSPAGQYYGSGLNTNTGHEFNPSAEPDSHADADADTDTDTAVLEPKYGDSVDLAGMVTDLDRDEIGINLADYL